jgi:hypothetical protein
MAGWEAFATNDGSTYFCFPQALLAVVTVHSEALVYVFIFPYFSYLLPCKYDDDMMTISTRMAMTMTSMGTGKAGKE